MPINPYIVILAAAIVGGIITCARDSKQDQPDPFIRFIPGAIIGFFVGLIPFALAGAFV